MASTLHETGALTTNTQNHREALPVPDDYRVEEVVDPEDDPEDIKILEAFWDGEAKIRAELDLYDGLASIDQVGRPGHWGEDIRTAEEQKPEYRLGLDGILRLAMAMPVEAVEVSSQRGVIASAIMELKVPVGWERLVKIIKYDSWSNSELIDIREAVADGAVISIRYEKNVPSHPGVGQVATASLLQDTQTLSEVA